jgi:hypothetical protein
LRRLQEDPGSGDQELRGVERLTLPAIGRRGLGVSRVRGRILVPNPYDTSYIINLRGRRLAHRRWQAQLTLGPTSREDDSFGSGHVYGFCIVYEFQMQKTR